MSERAATTVADRSNVIADAAMVHPAEAGSTELPSTGPSSTELPSTELSSTGQAPEVLVADLLVEEVSIDGMCGVY